ncbi:MAG: carboxypeptidase-like regulatory domain-containing protein, partial [Candidatus Eiseniibacteriota bacterium]
AAPAPTPTTGGEANRVGQVRKKLGATPLDAQKPSATAKTDDGGARGESRSREYLFAQPPAESATRGMTPQAPARGTEGETRVCGEVRDAAERPVAGARVVLTDLGRTTTTDAAGRFCLGAPKGEHPLTVMAVGYRESRQNVRAEGREADVRVTLAAVPVLEGQGLVRGGRAGGVRMESEPQAKQRAEAPGEPRDRYAALSDTLRGMVREARRLAADAAARRSAGHYDFAARAWERVLRPLAGGPLEVETRRHVAEARYRAWETGPNSRRALAAVEALTAYASRAPAGPERDQAARWLDRVRP